jgi:NADH-quinone oxidoreductase subunit H
MISYEVSIGLVIMPVLFFAGSANLSEIVWAQKTIYFCFPLFPSCVLFFISILAETTVFLLIYQRQNLNWFLALC